MDHSVKAAQENILIGRIIGLRMFRVTEFGTRVSFKIESAERWCVTCVRPAMWRKNLLPIIAKATS